MSHIKTMKRHKNNFAPAFLGYTQKRAVSEIISYVLLIVIALGISTAVYQWMSTRTPSVSGTCPEDVSLYLKNYNCNSSICNSGKCLNLTIKNNGNFNIDGIFIRASNNISTIPAAGLKYTESNYFDDIQSYNETGRLYFKMMNDGGGEPLAPGKEIELVFSYENIVPLKKIQIEPFVIDKSSMQLCTDATVNIEVDNSNKHCD